MIIIRYIPAHSFIKFSFTYPDFGILRPATFSFHRLKFPIYQISYLTNINYNSRICKYPGSFFIKKSIFFTKNAIYKEKHEKSDKKSTGKE